MSDPWMIYGAYGYTGELAARQAVSLGHRPLLAGRSAEKLAPLADELKLEWKALSLDEPRLLADGLRGMKLVFHAAGPFQFTSQPMIQACLAAEAHYTDITGEIPVFQYTFSQDAAARQKGIALISGCGFDVIPTDCLSCYVANKLPSATQLEIAFAGLSSLSAGTARSSIEMMPRGGMRRSQGRLVSFPVGSAVRRVRFSDHERTVLSISWGDLETAYRSTGIPNITTYMAYPRRFTRILPWVGPLTQNVMKLGAARWAARKVIARTLHGPSETVRKQGRAYIWAQARDEQGNTAQAWLETMEGYQFTAVAGLRCVEKILAGNLSGAFTPAQAFGPDFVLEIEGTKRYDELE